MEYYVARQTSSSICILTEETIQKSDHEKLTTDAFCYKCTEAETRDSKRSIRLLRYQIPFRRASKYLCNQPASSCRYRSIFKSIHSFEPREVSLLLASKHWVYLTGVERDRSQSLVIPAYASTEQVIPGGREPWKIEVHRSGQTSSPFFCNRHTHQAS